MSEVNSSDFVAKLEKAWRKFCKTAKKAKNTTLTSFTHWIDPKLQPYRAQNSKTTVEKPLEAAKNPDLGRGTDAAKNPPEGSENAEGAKTPENAANFAVSDAKFAPEIPTSREEFLEILHNIPLAVFSHSQRKQLEAILNFDLTSVEELMLPKNRIVYVDENEMLGPLTLDRLFRSGMKHFPVTDAKNHIIGCIHTARLNSLDIKQSSKARDIIDPNVYYVREDYTLEQALEVFLRTESYFVLVVNRYGKIVGILNFADLTRYLFGKLANDGFLHDDDRLAVAKRQFAVDISRGKNG